MDHGFVEPSVRGGNIPISVNHPDENVSWLPCRFPSRLSEDPHPHLLASAGRESPVPDLRINGHLCLLRKQGWMRSEKSVCFLSQIMLA